MNRAMSIPSDDGKMPNSPILSVFGCPLGYNAADVETAVLEANLNLGTARAQLVDEQRSVAECYLLGKPIAGTPSRQRIIELEDLIGGLEQLRIVAEHREIEEAIDACKDVAMRRNDEVERLTTELKRMPVSFHPDSPYPALADREWAARSARNSAYDKIDQLEKRLNEIKRDHPALFGAHA